MRRLCIGTLAAAGLLLTGGMALDYAKQSGATAMPAARSVPVTKLRAARESSSDLEVGGELAGLPPGVTKIWLHPWVRRRRRPWSSQFAMTSIALTIRVNMSPRITRYSCSP